MQTQDWLHTNGQTYQLTDHVQLRMAQRNISTQDLEFVLENGRRKWTYRGQAFALGRRNIPEKLRADDEIRRLVGTIVIVTENNDAIITVYRNRDFGKLRRKISS